MSVTSLLPPNATAQERSIEAAIARAGEFASLVKSLWNPDTCPAALLPWLAFALSLDKWNDAWTEIQQRAAIKASYYVHAHKGTIGAVRKALEAIDYELKVVEWFEKAPAGTPYTFDIQVKVSDRGINDAVYKDIEDIVNATKNVRSHLGTVTAVAVLRGTLNSLAATLSGEYVTVYPEAI